MTLAFVLPNASSNTLLPILTRAPSSRRANTLSRTTSLILAPCPAASSPSPLTHNRPTASPAPTPSPSFTLAPSSFSPFPSAPAPARSGKAIVWFRADLRLDDHAAFAAAAEASEAVLPLYTFDPRHFGETDLGFQKTGRQRAQFILDSVSALRTALRARGSDLVVRHDANTVPEDLIPAIARETGATAVYFHREATYDDQAVERRLVDALRRDGVEPRPFWGASLYHIDDLPFPIDDMPDVYTDFREDVEAAVAVREPVSVPEFVPPLPAKVDAGVVPSMGQLGMRTAATEEGGGAGLVGGGVARLKGGEEEAMRRLEAYVAQATVGGGGAAGLSSSGTGAAASASAFLGAEFSCQISPWLALGCISARRIYAALAKAGGSGGAPVKKTTTYFELVWRDFFKFVTWKYAAQRLDGKGRRAKTRASMGERASASSVNYIAASRG